MSRRPSHRVVILTTFGLIVHSSPPSFHHPASSPCPMGEGPHISRAAQAPGALAQPHGLQPVTRLVAPCRLVGIYTTAASSQKVLLAPECLLLRRALQQSFCRPSPSSRTDQLRGLQSRENTPKSRWLRTPRYVPGVAAASQGSSAYFPMLPLKAHRELCYV